MASNLQYLLPLSKDPWFAALPLRDRKTMLAESEIVRLRRGEMLFRQGDPPGGFYALVSGTMKMSTLSEEGKEAILIILETGTWFGEISLIDHQPRTHDATSLTEAEILVMGQKSFDALMCRNSFSLAIAEMLARRIRLLYGIVEDNGLRSTHARVARRLLLLANGGVGGKQIPQTVVPVSQEALAMMLGVTRQTLSKELKLLSQQRVISLGYRSIEILSADTLRVLSEQG